MSYLDRIRSCNSADMACFRPFMVEGMQLGWLKSPFVDELRNFPAVFRVTADAVTLAPDLGDVEGRSRAVDEVLRSLASRGIIEHWREEVYPVMTHWGSKPVLYMERAAVPLFGVRAFGVHLNGFVGHGPGMHMWIARRAIGKPTYPGMLDNLVAGGQPANISVTDNLVKECLEEANIPENLARRAKPTGAVSYVMETAAGLKPDVMFIYDLELSPEFNPENTDGEVDEFYPWPIAEVMQMVHDTEQFKFNCNLVVIQFLIRHGFITPDDRDYLEIVEGLIR